MNNFDNVAPTLFVTPASIDLVLFCPACGTQHIDAEDEATGWTNPQHCSHLCASCGHVWRPADVCTNGVADINTHGKADTTPPVRNVVLRYVDGQVTASQPVEAVHWKVRERRAADGSLSDCFIEAPPEGDMAYGLEVLGDDYEGFGGVERKLEHCKLIVSLVNTATPTEAPASQPEQCCRFPLCQPKEVQDTIAANVHEEIYGSAPITAPASGGEALSDPAEPMDDSDRIKPCPHCSSDAEVDKTSDGGYFIQCLKCGASTALVYGTGDNPLPILMERWNRRTTKRGSVTAPAAEEVGLYGKPGVRDDGVTRSAVECGSGDGDCTFPDCRCRTIPATEPVKAAHLASENNGTNCAALKISK